MPSGFFSAAELAVLPEPVETRPRCGLCKLEKGCVTPKIKTFGRGGKGILVVGQSPGEEEDRAGRLMVGTSSRHLRETFARYGVDVENDCWLTNCLICRPPKNKIPNDKMILWCRPNLTAEVERLKPRQIILLGENPVRSVVGVMWKQGEADAGIWKWAGWKIPWRKYNCWVCPTYHPSHVEHLREKEDEVVRGVFEAQMRDFCRVKGRPFTNGVPNDNAAVEIIYDSDEAARRVAKINGLVSFDFETDRLKPDHEDSSIACCSVSDGVTAFAFPWRGAVVGEMKALLADKGVGKIGANINFETRWVRRHLGVWVKNWKWDVVLAAHALDTRTAVTSVKFQAFVRLGVGDYDSHVRPFLVPPKPGGNEPNRVYQCDRESLLKYCALDSLYEFQIAQHQAREMGISLTGEDL